MSNIVRKWNDKAEEVLLKRRITHVEYISTEEAKDYMWYNIGVWFQLDDGTRLICMRDDEGNDAGVLAYLNKGVDSVLPVIDFDYEDKWLNKKEK